MSLNVQLSVNLARGATFCVRLKELNWFQPLSYTIPELYEVNSVGQWFQLCSCTILAENDAPRAKFRLVENRRYSDQQHFGEAIWSKAIYRFTVLCKSYSYTICAAII